MTDRIHQHAPGYRRHLPRLSPEWYRGYAFVHWTLGIDQRRTGWLDDVFHAGFREVLVHAGCRYGFVCPTYCLMPDHVHMLWVGVRADSRQRVAMEFLQKHTRSRLRGADWQKEPYDHVLREAERECGAFQRTAGYILENPVRKGLAGAPSEYAYSGCVVVGYPSLSPAEDDYWDKFWRIYYRLRGENEVGSPDSAT